MSCTRELSITISGNCDVVTIDETAFPEADLNVDYSESLTAVGGTPPYTWTLISGSLPDGMSFSAEGVLSGTPTTSGDFNLTIQVVDADGHFCEQEITLHVEAGFGPGITCDVPTGGLIGMPATVTCADFDTIRIANGQPAVGAVAIVTNGPTDYDYHSVSGPDPPFIPRLGDVMSTDFCTNLTPGEATFTWILVCNLNANEFLTISSAQYQKPSSTNASPLGTYVFQSSGGVAQAWPATVEVT